MIIINHLSYSHLSQKLRISSYGPWGCELNLRNFDFQLSKDITLNLKKTFCKQYYKPFAEEIKTEPTAIKSWRKNCPEVADNWVNYIQDNYKITTHNKLRLFFSSCCTEY